MPHVLIVDDDPSTREALGAIIGGDGLTTATAGDLREARIQLVRQTPDVIFTDLKLPDGSGVDLFEDLDPRSGVEVIVITGHATVESAVNALKMGATDYLVKPINMQRVKAILSRLPRPGDLKAEIGTLRGELRRMGRFGLMLGNSPAMQTVYDQVGRVAPTAAAVLLIGESGTGKEVAAETLHELSLRRKHSFIAVNCGAVSPQLIESELFGHEKGSFTSADRQHKGYFERANGGTLFLDEITEMPQELQVKLLRVLETGTFTRVGTTQQISADVRLIAATNRNPETAVAEGKLREDLYHRLNVFPIAMPPLRERTTDIELLAQHFLDQLNKQENASKSFAPAAIAALYVHSWPGNVRELKNYVQRAFILADDVIDATLAPSTVAAPESAPLLTVRVGTTLDEVGRRLIEATLAECGSKRKAADMLGISLKTLYNRLAVYKASDPEAEEEDEVGAKPAREEHRRAA